MRIAKLQLSAAVVAAAGFVAIAGVGTGYALTRPGQTVAIPLALGAPANVATADEPKPEEWTPNRGEQGNGAMVPSAFPDLKAPERPKGGNYLLVLQKLCPRILGDDPPVVVATDDTYRRLLKARLHQGRLYIATTEEVLAAGKWDPKDFVELYSCLNDMRTIVQELWENDPKAVIRWLEEFVILGKRFESYFQFRALAGSDAPQINHAATRHRLEAEAALWKAKKRG